MTATDTNKPRTAARRRAAAAALAVAAAATDLAAKAWANTALPDAPVHLGPIDLRLAFNPGVAFSFGDTLPAWAVIAFTGLITAAIALFAWRTAPTSKAAGAALAVILGGAAANLADRAGDGVVTDYLHTGWWPTFNLADVFIVCGGLAVVALSWRRTAQEHGDTDPPAAA
ncbi:signal peptidase II [Streptomyces sp. NBC_00160]|uniref:signal peptidase II n=1 Tax=Streptomyces sp. NBC_00160 TaxID=2903628 RepID=UPI00225401D5|nr:signal peptidase II [Streptomyces sp. NBC_00160]MCX5302833.1 signal peptidase II [Streptomyces sp. NBC_00160]